MSHNMQSTPPPRFTYDNSLSSWNMPAKDWLIKNQKDKEWDGLATASIVFNPHGKVLLIQRAAHDSMPNKWEVPGGACDDDDPTVLHGAARELWEESGLVAKHFTHAVNEGPGSEPGQVFPNSTRTKVWCRFAFHVEVGECGDVKLDPNEHQDFLWASEEHVREQSMGDRELPITKESLMAVILEAFRLRKQKAIISQAS